MKLNKEIIKKAQELKAEFPESCRGTLTGQDVWNICISNAIAEAQEAAREAEIDAEIAREKGEYEIEVETSGESRKGGVYVAKITGPDKQYGLHREFFDLNTVRDRHTKEVFGKITVREGDYIEIGRGGSWKNYYRDMYQVVGGELEYIGSATSASVKKQVLQALIA